MLVLKSALVGILSRGDLIQLIFEEEFWKCLWFESVCAAGEISDLFRVDVPVGAG